jgi:hypothetical protein
MLRKLCLAVSLVALSSCSKDTTPKADLSPTPKETPQLGAGNISREDVGEYETPTGKNVIHIVTFTDKSGSKYKCVVVESLWSGDGKSIDCGAPILG